MSQYGPPDRELSRDLTRIANSALTESKRERVLFIGESGESYEVQGVVEKHEIDIALHLVRLAELREMGAVKAVMHVGLQRQHMVHVHLLEHSRDLYRLAMRNTKPRGVRWIPVSKEAREKWLEVWGDNL